MVASEFLPLIRAFPSFCAAEDNSWPPKEASSFHFSTERKPLRTGILFPKELYVILKSIILQIRSRAQIITCYGEKDGRKSITTPST
jgi:hypothetical protein